ncbi:threonine synthase [Nitratifractor salsuginis]|uniref:Threonine synthase n=1 Tax=Nitratifractor salsuginis (strain DSM 16511 / JCM 12458 / E9I37-1) TaxID=749222 RepID=E6X079_NITSE|nr:threonine synthase [Nitratifractor salsuginis]ADV45668.1 L-threonine synthase [Nitratifractor salsuginis DSM 16511]
MQFIETRGNDGKNPAAVPFSEAILNPRASYGGLYVPESLPDMSIGFLSEYLQSDYKTLAFALLKAFEIDIDDELLHKALERYDRFDDPNNPVPVVGIEEDLYVSELYHGPTRAFKDMALQPFGVILSTLAKRRNERYLIMAATSGDTGPATLETFKNRENIKVTCLYPEGGTSDVQRLQMVTEDAPNLKVIGVKGNFDDTQHALKELLSSETFREELRKRDLKLSAANSVNFGRIIFQIIYHIHSYLELVRQNVITLGEEIYLVVPSGNFGNALGAYYAKKAGLPVRKILIASNANNILTDWIRKGEYDLRGRCLIQTESPAMDILISSNVERVLYDKFGPERTRELMEALSKEGHYSLTPEELKSLQEDFDATFSSDEEGEKIIARYAERGYLMDPHTATCLKAYRELRREPLATVIYSTAEWTKFSRTVARAIGIAAETDKEALDAVSRKLGVLIPKVISELFNKPIVHTTVVEKEEIMQEMLSFL